MNSSLVTVAYIAASALFILSLAGLSNQETARKGNLFGIIGMAIALLATAFSGNVSITGYATLAAMILPGALIGAALASRVAMTSMPELVAILHSFVGLAAVLVGIGNYLGEEATLTGAEVAIHQIEIYLGVFIGSVTFAGSIVAFAKLRELISSKPLMLPGRYCRAGCAVYGWRLTCRTSAPADYDGDRLCPWTPSGCGDRWSGYARGYFHAQQLFWLGGSSGWVYAQQ
jgi:H+-translocating NAD(P) transhydrogenase subunit beta